MAPPEKVLVLSRDARFREPATEVLLRSGFVVDEALDADTALGAAASARPPDFMLVDSDTLGSGTLGFLTSLQASASQKQQPERATRIVMVAGEGATEQVRRHPLVDYIIEAPAVVRSLLTVADWLEERRDPGLRPLASASPGDDSEQRERQAG